MHNGKRLRAGLQGSMLHARAACLRKLPLAPKGMHKRSHNSDWELQPPALHSAYQRHVLQPKVQASFSGDVLNNLNKPCACVQVGERKQSAHCACKVFRQHGAAGHHWPARSKCLDGMCLQVVQVCMSPGHFEGLVRMPPCATAGAVSRTSGVRVPRSMRSTHGCDGLWHARGCHTALLSSGNQSGGRFKAGHAEGMVWQGTAPCSVRSTLCLAGRLPVVCALGQSYFALCDAIAPCSHD